MKSLLDGATKTAASLEITRNDVKNKINRIKKKKEGSKNQAIEVSPSDSTPHLTATATVVVDETPRPPPHSQGLDILANTAALTSVSPPDESTTTCTWPGCVYSDNTPDKCSICEAGVHRLCQAAGESANSWTSHVECKLFCFGHHPCLSPTLLANSG